MPPVRPKGEETQHPASTTATSKLRLSDRPAREGCRVAHVGWLAYPGFVDQDLTLPSQYGHANKAVPPSVRLSAPGKPRTVPVQID
ncbi:hypothetical protein E2C01_102062 [Portunus trituberculatus]|uniref:Uncharacterized protein n=1 Tax=Portunus trituberculatus TaxID=210409 RepID=A0A5B7KLP4_PORTR|nr:hypothetical protein [Portunus trituberculatus]